MASGFNTSGSGMFSHPKPQGFIPIVKSAISKFDERMKKPAGGGGSWGGSTKKSGTSGTQTPAPKPASTPTYPTNTQQTTPGILPSSAPQQGTPQYYANQVTQASQPNALSTGATTAAATYGMLGNQRQLQPFAGGATQGLDQSYANLTRPQSTANFAGESGLFDVQRGILQNAAQQTAANALEQQRIQQAGATTNLTASLPQTISYGQTAYNPLQGQNIPGIGGNAFQGGVQQGQVAQGQLYAQMNGAHQASQGIKGQVQQYLAQNPNLNPSIFTSLNSALQFLNGQVGNPQYQTLSNYINEYISTLAPILGVGGDTTNLKTQIAQGFVNAQANGQSINDVLNNIDQLAQIKLNAISTAGQGGQVPTGGSSGSTGGGLSGYANGGAF